MNKTDFRSMSSRHSFKWFHFCQEVRKPGSACKQAAQTNATACHMYNFIVSIQETDKKVCGDNPCPNFFEPRPVSALSISTCSSGSWHGRCRNLCRWFFTRLTAQAPEVRGIYSQPPLGMCFCGSGNVENHAIHIEKIYVTFYFQT